jgi:hypothetical protein
MGKIPGMKQAAMAKNMQKMMAGGGMPGIPGMLRPRATTSPLSPRASRSA